MNTLSTRISHRRVHDRCRLVAARAHNPERSTSTQAKVWAVAAAGVLSLSLADGALAKAGKVGEFTASGFIFKDTVDVLAFDDPEITNVTIYLSDMKRSIADKFAKDFFNDPSSASLSCTLTGVPEIKDIKKIRGKAGHEIFSEGKNLSLFQQKTLRVQRVLDEERGVVAYISYSTRLTSASDDGGVSSGRYKTSICSLPVPLPAPELVE